MSTLPQVCAAAEQNNVGRNRELVKGLGRIEGYVPFAIRLDRDHLRRVHSPNSRLLHAGTHPPVSFRRVRPPRRCIGLGVATCWQRYYRAHGSKAGAVGSVGQLEIVRTLTTVLFLLSACAVLIASAQLIPVQQAAFGETQALALLLGETTTVITLAYIAEARKKKRHHLVPRLIWLSFVPLLLSIGYVQLPASRAARPESRVRVASARSAAYRASHQGKSCPPLDAELEARKLEWHAAMLRQRIDPAPNSAFEASVTFAGALGAALLAALTGRKRAAAG